jgi:hypothetical protein
MIAQALLRILPLAALLVASPALAADRSPTGFEVGVRTGYAFAAGDTGATATLQNNPVGDYVSGVWPLWFDAGYRLSRNLYLGGYFQYGFGFVNDDRQTLCRNADVDCSASDTRLGLMFRYQFAPSWPLAPWAGYGFGYEWGGYSVGETNSDWSGIEFMNLQVGADYALPHGLVLAPFFSFSLGQFRSVTTTAPLGAVTLTLDEDVESHSLHEWVLIGVRFAFRP